MHQHTVGIRGGRRAAGRGQLRCRWFVERYSDYRDDGLDQAARLDAVLHLRSCPSCRRYDRVIRRGVEELRRADSDRGAGGRGTPGSAVFEMRPRLARLP